MKSTACLFSLLLFVIVSCSPPKKNWTFAKENVSFTGPGDWRITDKDNLNGAGYYMAVEEDGLNSSGLYILTWFNQMIDSMAYLDKLHDGFENRKELDNLKFEAIRNTNYNGIPAISCDFSFSILNVKTNGTITIFSKSNKTYSITEQWAVDDEQETQDEFQLFEKTFRIK